MGKEQGLFLFSGFVTEYVILSKHMLCTRELVTHQVERHFLFTDIGQLCQRQKLQKKKLRLSL